MRYDHNPGGEIQLESFGGGLIRDLILFREILLSKTEPLFTMRMIMIQTSIYADYQHPWGVCCPIWGILVAARFPPFFRGHEAQLPPATQSFNIVPQFLLPKKFCQISLSFNITLFHNFSCQFYFYFKYLCPSTLFHNFPINNLSFKYIPPSTVPQFLLPNLLSFKYL